MTVIETFSAGPEQTRDLAAAIADLCQPSDLLVLSGDLGAGKTVFAQGFGAALGVTDTITSPTFTLARQYSGRLTMHHLDVYRIEQLEEVRDLALPELLDGQSVTLIEWGDNISPALPNDYLELRLNYGDGDDDRHIELRCVGPRWSARSAALCRVLEPWTETPC